jgi:cysteine sulfinate desulfinase/cysteine desulfurase-like protein
VARTAVRFTLGTGSSDDDVDRVLAELPAAVLAAGALRT